MSALARRWKQWQLGGGWVGNRGTKARRSTHSHRSTHPHLRTNSKAQTPRLQQKPWLLVRLFRKASSIPCRVFFCSILCCILIAPRAVCGCSTSSLLSREACTVWQHVCVQLCVGTVVGIPAYVLCCCCTAVFEPVREWYRSYRCLCDTSATVQTIDLSRHCGWWYSYLLLQRARGDHTPIFRLYLRPDKLCEYSLWHYDVCTYLRRTSVLSLVPVVALLFSDSTSPLLCHVACTIRKKVCVNFWVGSTAMLTTDVYLTDTLQFYVRYLRDNGAGPILLFVIHLRPWKHGMHPLRLAVLVRPDESTCWLYFCPDKRYEYEY